MEYTVEPMSARTDEELDGLFADGFPPFATADLEVKRYIGRVRQYFPHLDVVLVDRAGKPAAAGWGVPVPWDGEVTDLPGSFADVLRRAVEAHEAGTATDTFVICGGVVHPALRGTGAAQDLVQALKDLGRSIGLSRCLAPVRPTLKHRYPLFGIEEYLTWVREDGLPFDPWLRLHVRAGGSVLAPCPAAQTMTGSVADWEGWAGIALPADGAYVIPQGLGPLHVDRATDTGVYVEPNIWVRHA